MNIFKKVSNDLNKKFKLRESNGFWSFMYANGYTQLSYKTIQLVSVDELKNITEQEILEKVSEKFKSLACDFNWFSEKVK